MIECLVVAYLRSGRLMITQLRLKELLSYDESTGLFTRLVARRGPNGHKGAIAGCNNGQGYIRMYVDGEAEKAHRLVWLYVHGELPPHEIDHINGIRSDNRLMNLRSVERVKNAKNRPTYKTNAAGIKGVSFNKRANKWVAQIQCDGKKIGLGYFLSKEEAAVVYEAAAKKYFGEFMRAA